jgi:hypothetical protein
VRVESPTQLTRSFRNVRDMNSYRARPGPPRGRSSSHGTVKRFLFCTSSNRLWSPPSVLSSGTWVHSPELKRPGRKADHSHQLVASADKLTGKCTSCSMGVDLGACGACCCLKVVLRLRRGPVCMHLTGIM